MQKSSSVDCGSFTSQHKPCLCFATLDQGRGGAKPLDSQQAPKLMILENNPLQFTLNAKALRKLLDDVTRNAYPIGDLIIFPEELDVHINLLNYKAHGHGRGKVWNCYLAEQTRWWLNKKLFLSIGECGGSPDGE